MCAASMSSARPRVRGPRRSGVGRRAAAQAAGHKGAYKRRAGQAARRGQGGAGLGGFSIRVGRRGDRRVLTVDARDAGRFLRGMDAVRGMQGGHLTIDGTLDSASGLYPLAGTLVIDDVVVRNSPFLGKLLQAITVYGLLDVLRGPGMTFSRVVVPFRYDGTELRLDDAHAANPSLGLTAKGRIGLDSGSVAVSGTIVPAYFFNSMLGQLPLVGKLFSPEKGGGRVRRALRGGWFGR